MAVPSDMYVQGYDGKGVAKLRLWQAKAPEFDLSSFSLGNYKMCIRDRHPGAPLQWKICR